MTRSGEEVFAATLLKINPRGRGQSRPSSMSSWLDRMAHTEILELSLFNWAAVEIAVTMHEFDARGWMRGVRGGRNDGLMTSKVGGCWDKEGGR